jgi:hypothetical protein
MAENIHTFTYLCVHRQLHFQAQLQQLSESRHLLDHILVGHLKPERKYLKKVAIKSGTQ